jgi:hypothetical protein
MCSSTSITTVLDVLPDLVAYIPADESTESDDTAVGLEDPAPSEPLMPLSSMTMTGPRAMSVAEIIKAGHLPPPQMGFIPQVEKAVRVLARTPATRERISEYIQNEVGCHSILARCHCSRLTSGIRQIHD